MYDNDEYWEWVDAQEKLGNFMDTDKKYIELNKELEEAKNNKYRYSGYAILHEEEMDFISSLSKKQYDKYKNLCDIEKHLEDNLDEYLRQSGFNC